MVRDDADGPHCCCGLAPAFEVPVSYGIAGMLCYSDRSGL